MPQDAFTLKYLCAEFNEVFSNGKVNRIIQPSNDEIMLTVYTSKKCTKKMLINVNPSSPRISICNQEKDSPLTAPNFCMLMRKHLLSATILGVELVGFDRIVKIDFLSCGEFFDAVKKTLYIELMGRYSNIILTENAKILGGNRGINMFDNGVRPLIVGKEYVYPPVNDKKLPNDKDLINIFANINNDNIAEIICKNIQGIATSTAKEIEEKFLSKFNQNLSENFASELFNFINDYLYNTTKKPCVIVEDNLVKDVCVYPYNSTGEIIEFDYLFEAEDYYFEKKDNLKIFKSKFERLNGIINSAIKKAKKKLVSISSRENDALSAEENRLKGELILANIYRLKDGEKVCILDNYYDGSKIEILLDERLSISKNAENYFKKYNKQKRTLDALKPQKEQAQKELDYFNSVSDEIALAENIFDLDLIKVELEKAGLIVEKQTTAKKKKEESVFYREYIVDGFIIKAGRNNAENDKLTFSSPQTDTWLHAKDYHSSHLIIESGGREIPEKVLTIASEICAYYSRGRDGGKTEVVYTLRKNVKKPPKSKLGFCTYDNYKSMVVSPKKHTEFLKNE